MPRLAISWLLGLLGAVLGGIVGYYGFHWILEQGIYAVALPGALVGIGCWLLSRGDSSLRGFLCLVAAIILGVYAEWSAFPFVKDGSLGYFVRHVHQLPTIKLIFIGLGGAMAYWFGQGHYYTPRYDPRSAPPETACDQEARPLG